MSDQVLIEGKNLYTKNIENIYKHHIYTGLKQLYNDLYNRDSHLILINFQRYLMKIPILNKLVYDIDYKDLLKKNNITEEYLNKQLYNLFSCYHKLTALIEGNTNTNNFNQIKGLCTGYDFLVKLYINCSKALYEHPYLFFRKNGLENKENTEKILNIINDNIDKTIRELLTIQTPYYKSSDPIKVKSEVIVKSEVLAKPTENKIELDNISLNGKIEPDQNNDNKLEDDNDKLEDDKLEDDNLIKINSTYVDNLYNKSELNSVNIEKVQQELEMNEMNENNVDNENNNDNENINPLGSLINPVSIVHNTSPNNENNIDNENTNANENINEDDISIEFENPVINENELENLQIDDEIIISNEETEPENNGIELGTENNGEIVVDEVEPEINNIVNEVEPEPEPEIPKVEPEIAKIEPEIAKIEPEIAKVEPEIPKVETDEIIVKDGDDIISFLNNDNDSFNNYRDFIKNLKHI